MPKGVTQEQCAGMIDHPAQLGKRHRYNPMQQCQMALKQTLVSAIGTNKLNISKVMPGLHKSPCTSCHTKPVLGRSQHLQLRYW
jgi:hypothetical protein